MRHENYGIGELPFTGLPLNNTESTVEIASLFCFILSILSVHVNMLPALFRVIPCPSVVTMLTMFAVPCQH